MTAIVYTVVKRVMLNGRKIVCFYENIMGEDTCTIDGHARNIAYNERVNLTDNKTNIGVKEYANLQMAYRQAAKRCTVNGRVQGIRIAGCDMGDMEKAARHWLCISYV